MAALFAAAEEGRGIIQSVANLSAPTPSWPVTADEARHWRRQVCRASGLAPWLAVDGVGPNHEAIRRELEDLSSGAFGPQLRLVATADEAVAKKLKKLKKLMEHPNGRSDAGGRPPGDER